MPRKTKNYYDRYESIFEKDKETYKDIVRCSVKYPVLDIKNQKTGWYECYNMYYHHKGTDSHGRCIKYSSNETHPLWYTGRNKQRCIICPDFKKAVFFYVKPEFEYMLEKQPDSLSNSLNIITRDYAIRKRSRRYNKT